MLKFLFGAFSIIVTGVAMAEAIPSGLTDPWAQPYVFSIKDIDSFAILLSALIAVYLYRATIKRHQQEDDFKASEVYLTEAKELLEKTYELFSGGEDGALPDNSRVMWLTIARMIVRYQTLKGLIGVASHKNIIESNEAFWRFKFYSILKENSEAFTSDYFKISKQKYQGDEIDRKSIAVIFDFAAWKGEDPLDGVDDIELFASGGNLLFNYLGLHRFLQEGGYWDRVLKRQVAIREEDNAAQEVE